MGYDTSQGMQGAMGGAMAGSAIAPGIGTLIGGGLGLLGGFGGSDDRTAPYQEMLKNLAAGYGKRTAPKAGPASLGQNSQFRGNQAALIAQLEAMGRGDGPSAARVQMQDAMDRAAGAQASAAAGAGGRGVNAGAALRGAMNNTAAIQSQGARDTSQLRAQEQMGALSQLGGVINQGRQSDEGMSQFNAGAQNQVNMGNLQSQLQTMGLNQSGQLQALLGLLGNAQSQNASHPGLGTQIMAGGAAATPGLAQMFGKNKTAPYGGGWANGQGSLYGMGGPSPTPDPWAASVGSGMGSGTFSGPQANTHLPDDPNDPDNFWRRMFGF